MQGTSFKNYVVNYDLVVNSTASEGFTQVAQMAQRMQKPLKDLSNHFKRLQQSAAALKKGGAFEIKPTIDFATFDKQSQTLITKAEQTAAKVNAILNGAFTINPAAAKDKSGGKGTKGATTPSKTEKRTLTTKQLQKEAENVKKQLRDLYGPRGSMSAGSKNYKALVESLQNDVGKLGNLKALRAQLAAINADIRTASKNGGKITKTITDGVAQGVVAGGKKGGKKLINQPQVTEAFNSVLQGLVAGKAVQIPVSVVANAKTAESINSSLAKMRGQIKPLVIPITVATNIDAAKAVRETVQGLQNIITPSTTGTKAVGKGKGTRATTPVAKTGEQKALEKELRGLQSEQNKYNFWKQKHDEWSDKAAAIKQGGATTKLPTEPVLAQGIRTPEQIEARRTEINRRLAEIKGSTPVPVKTKTGARGGGGISIPIAENLRQLQTLAGGRGINLNTRIVSTGQAGFDLNQHIAQLQNIANGRPIRLDTRVIPTGQAGFDLNMHIQKLQELALAHPIKLNTIIAPNTTGVKGGKGTALQNTVPMEGLVENIVVSKAVKVSGGPVKVEGLVESVKASKGMKPIELKANVVAPGLKGQVNLLRELSNVWKTLPKTGSRTYTVNLKMPGIENIGKLRELASMVGTMPPSQRRVYNQGQSQAGGRGVGSQSMYVGRGPNMATRYAGRPRGTMNTFAYQLMGNTSLGARTPVFLDMMKGMGMMSGVGAAMSTLTNAFTNASEYQNTMVTAKSILEANYQGSDFNRDFGNMERIVRDVARNTKFTAPQAADAARFMAMAGLNIPMINASIRPIADVAVIGDNDLGEVADKITNIQTAFGIQPNKMRALADALTKTFTSSNTDMMMLAESMEYAAPMAHLAGAQVEDALAMIGVMGNAGIQGSMAGTTLRMMYQNVINPNKKQQKMWNELGISLKDAHGNPRQLIDILGDLRKKVRLSNDDKNLDGTWKDEGTPIAEAVSRLFRVTASAGAGTLLENLDKVIALAEANRNADGLSQRISEVKQNDVKGMWAKMTSAFTDAVVTEFENNESPIKGYLENLTKYFNSPDFKDMLHDIFDLVTSMMDTLGHFAKIWKGIYDTCGGLIKYVLMAQFWMTQIGYLFAPLRSVWMTIARGYGAMKGLTMGGAAMGAVGGAGVMGSTAAMAGGAAMMGGGAKFTNKAILEAQQRAARFDQASFISKGRFNDVSAAHAANAAKLEAQIAKKQMQWYAMSNLTGTERALRANDNRSGRWNLAYTNPQAASELPTRHKMMLAREREVAALQGQLANSQAGVSNAQAQMERDAARSSLAHQRTNFLIAAQRHKTRMPNMAALQRMQRMGKISGWGAKVARDGMLLRSAGSAISGALGMSGLLGGLATAGKALFSFATGPIGLTAIAVGALGFGIYKAIAAHQEYIRKNKEWQEIIQNDAIRVKENVNKALQETTLFNGLIDSIKTINVSTAEINVAEQKKSNNYLAQNENIATILGILTGERDKYGKLKGVSDQTIREAFSTYYEPIIKYFNDVDNNGQWGINDKTGSVRLTRALVAGQMFDSQELVGVLNELHSLAEQYQGGSLSWSDYSNKLHEIIEKQNPENIKGLVDITADNYLNALDPHTDVRSYRVWQETLYNYLKEIQNTDPILAQARGLNAFASNKNLAPYQRWVALKDLVQGSTITGFSNKETGVAMPFNLPMDERGIDWIKLYGVQSQTGVEYHRFAAMIEESLGTIYDKLLADKDHKWYLDGINRADFVSAFYNGSKVFLSPERIRELDEIQQRLKVEQARRDSVMEIIGTERYVAPTDHPITAPMQLPPLQLKKPSQIGYTSQYGTPQTMAPTSNTTIQKIEVNITNNGELDERKVAELVGKEVGRQNIGFMYNLIRPIA